MTAEMKVLITGATGGIGASTISALLAAGHSVMATGRDREALRALEADHADCQQRLEVLCADLSQTTDRERLVTAAATWKGGVNVLINNAGTADFSLFEDQSIDVIERLLDINLHIPIHLTHALLPVLRRSDPAHIVKIGSVFGAIGYPGNAVYCASKFGLRGFSESLRRELADTPVKVHLLAPRATQTHLNDTVVDALNAELGNAVDRPDAVARAVLHLFEGAGGTTVIGFPEKLFARINAVLPSLVDRALRKQLPIIRRYAAIRRTS